MLIERYLKEPIEADGLRKEKMVFISGPRQVGKSTLAKSFLKSEANYYLYDDEKFRLSWTKSAEESLRLRTDGPIVLDEIHKDRKWKSKVKALYDTLKLPLIVTGSARLDFYRKGADSLLGRYLPYRMHPFTVAESAKPIAPDSVFQQPQAKYSWNDLLTLGGFPEPLLYGEEQNALRWSRLRLDRLVLEDVRDFRNISDLNAFRVMIELLPERIGSVLSINSLSRDMSKAYASTYDWIKLLEVLYASFTIRPYSKKISRSLTSNPKLYLYDILKIPQELNSKRLENLTALHLLKACHFWTDSAQGEFELFYIRDKEKREVDFCVTRDRKPWMLVECKSNETNLDPSLIHFNTLLKPEHCLQLTTKQNYHRQYPAHGIQVLHYETFAAGLI